MHRQFYQTNAGNLSYLRRDGKYPILFIHGFTASAYIWRKLTSRLEPDFELIYVDLFGHGQSDFPEIRQGPIDVQSMIKIQASALEELLRGSGISHYSVVASSLGGWIAMELAVNHMTPDRAVLIDNAGFAPAGDSVFERELKALFAEYSNKSQKYGDFLNSVISSASLDGMSMDPQLPEKASFDVSVIWGEKDHILNPKYGREFAKALKNSTFTIIKGADHTPFTTHPVEVANIINSFLR